MPSSQVEELADAAKSLLEQIITDPFKRFYDVRREMIAWALAARKGAYKIEFDRRIGPYGDICFTNIDTRNLRWAEGYHPHDPGSNYHAGYLIAATLVAIAQGGELLAAAMKRRQPHWTGPDGDVLMHPPLHRAARAAGYHEQAASQDSSVLAAKVSCHAAWTAAPAGRVPFGWSRSRSNQPVPSASPSRELVNVRQSTPSEGPANWH